MNFVYPVTLTPDPDGGLAIGAVRSRSPHPTRAPRHIPRNESTVPGIRGRESLRGA